MTKTEHLVLSYLETSMKNNLKETIHQQPVVFSTIDMKSLQPQLADFIDFFEYKNDLNHAQITRESDLSGTTLKFMSNRDFDGDARVRKSSLDKLIEYVEYCIELNKDEFTQNIPDEFIFTEEIVDEIPSIYND